MVPFTIYNKPSEISNCFVCLDVDIASVPKGFVWFIFCFSSCYWGNHFDPSHYIDVIMTTVASQITSLMVVYSGADLRKHQSSASLAFVWGNSPGPVNSPHKGPVTRKIVPFDDVIMCQWSNPEGYKDMAKINRPQNIKSKPCVYFLGWNKDKCQLHKK